MNGTQVQAGYQPVHQEEATLRTLAGGALMESIGAIATVALAIAGLAGAYSITLAAIATIVLGAAIWLEGGAFIASHRAEVSGQTAGMQTMVWSQGLGAEFFGGLSGIVLGILALLGVAPMTLLSVAALVFGATFLFTSPSGFVSGTRAMFGFAGLILGLLAVCGQNPLTLVLAALLCLGASTLMNGAASGAKAAIASQK